MSERKDPFALPGSIPGIRPFGKESLNPKAPEEIFHRPGGGGSPASKKARDDRASQDQPENIQDRVIDFPVETPPASGHPGVHTVKLLNARWDREKGFFNKKAKAGVAAETLEGGKAKGRVEYTLYAIAPEGKSARIAGFLADIRGGHAEAEFTLFYAQDQPKGQSADYFFTAKHPESGELKSPILHVETLVCDDSPPPAPAEEVGTCPYYVWRNRNFIERHQGCTRTPPKYYMGYGYKYCVRFSTETYPKLSEKGKIWLGKARLRLQKAIEDELKMNGTIELDSEKFSEFTFASHPDAYWKAGLGDLHPIDLFWIGWTPDIMEWLDGKSRVQVYDIAGRLIEVWKEKAEEALHQRSNDVKEYFRNILR